MAVDIIARGMAATSVHPGSDGKIPAEYLPSYVDDVTDLIAVDSAAPAQCSEGDKYYNTTDKLIYTATGTNTWGSTGETPEDGKIYLNISANPATSYRWSGTDLVEVGQDLSNYMTLDSAQTVTGVKSFSNLPESSATPTTNNQLVNKKYVDDNAGGNIYLGKWSDYNSAENKLDLSSLKKGTYTIFVDDGYYLYIGSAASERLYNPVRNYNGYPLYFIAVLNMLKDREDWVDNQIIAKLSVAQVDQVGTNVRTSYWEIKYNSTNEQYTTSYYTIGASFIRQDNPNTTNVSTPINFTTLPASSVAPTTNTQLVNKKYVDDNVSQVSTLPTAASTNEGRVYQYTGTTTQDYTKGYFYQCISDNGIYSWKRVDTQPGRGIARPMYLGLNTDYSENNPLNLDLLELGTYMLIFYKNEASYNARIWLSKTVNGNVIKGDVELKSTSSYAIPTYLNYEVVPDGTESNFGSVDYIADDKHTHILLKCVTTGGSPGIYDNNYSGLTYITSTGAQNITAKKTFSVLPESSVVPTTNNQLVNKKYVDDTVSNAIGSINTILATLTTPSNNGGN